jgi:hypothetical protein
MLEGRECALHLAGQNLVGQAMEVSEELGRVADRARMSLIVRPLSGVASSARRSA